MKATRPASKPGSACPKNDWKRPSPPPFKPRIVAPAQVSNSTGVRLRWSTPLPPQLADTRKNQRRYPQPSAQKSGCGFPVLRFVALFSLTSGAILNVILGSLHHHDLRLLHRLWDQLKKGDILLGDRAYGEYTTLATGPRQGVDVVARLHGRRCANLARQFHPLAFELPPRLAIDLDGGQGILAIWGGAAVRLIRSSD